LFDETGTLLGGTHTFSETLVKEVQLLFCGALLALFSALISFRVFNYTTDFLLVKRFFGTFPDFRCRAFQPIFGNRLDSLAPSAPNETDTQKGKPKGDDDGDDDE
jgi:hypothetical protein